MVRTSGRPREADRPSLEEAIVLRALETFLERGYEKTSMEEIARRAGVSKQTVYARFPRKQDLFARVITKRYETNIMRPPALEEEVRDMSPRDFLESMGKNVFRYLHRDESKKLRRLVRSAYPHCPEVSNIFWQNGPGRGKTLVMSYLIDQCNAGRLRIPDPELAVEQFLGMVMGLTELSESVGIAVRPFTPAQETKWISGAVDVFLAFYEVR